MLVFRGHIKSYFFLFSNQIHNFNFKKFLSASAARLPAPVQTLNEVGTGPNLEGSIAVIWANACRQADFGRPNELHLY